MRSYTFEIGANVIGKLHTYTVTATPDGLVSVHIPQILKPWEKPQFMEGSEFGLSRSTMYRIRKKAQELSYADTKSEMRAEANHD
jgi:hypothetical protein